MPQPNCSIQLLCKAPLPGFAKTRLVSALGPEGVMSLQTQLVRRAARTAVSAAIGPVTLWCAPDSTHPLFAELARTYPVSLRNQVAGDLGRRMQVAVEHAFNETRGTILIGNDCPVLTADYLRRAADMLKHYDAILGPAEDGGYVLLALTKDIPVSFAGLSWGTGLVLRETLLRLEESRCTCYLLPALWDIDTPADLARWRALGAQGPAYD